MTTSPTPLSQSPPLTRPPPPPTSSPSRFACQEHTFYLNRPRWPNSGTILGPAGLLRPVYADLTDLAASRDANLGDQQLFMCAPGRNPPSLPPLPP